MANLTPEPKVRLIVGLGNPGSEYMGTRHNIGFAVLDVLARRYSSQFSFEKKWNADLVKISATALHQSDFMLMKPKTFMNLSGTAIARYAHFFHWTAMETLVVLDDVSLPLGTLRIRRSGSAGGQRGLESVLAHFSTEEVPRLRVGIGPVNARLLSKLASADEVQEAHGAQKSTQNHSEASLSNYVLSRFSTEERDLVEQSICRAVDAIECLQREGLDKAMNLYNAQNS
ncbi:MAG: aminoacyl-tRNA hydrolase [Chthoniobacterales bacterium]